MNSQNMRKIVFFAPEACKEKVKDALFTIGAGRLGQYECCSFEVKGHGQFRPLPGANPAIGSCNSLESLVEYRVEMLCRLDILADAIKVLKAAHDYEEPAYEVYSIETF